MFSKLSSLAFAAAAIALPLSAHADTSRDAEVRAAMVLNFARFAEWPASRFASPSSPVVLCAEKGAATQAALLGLEGEQIGDRRISVQVRDVNAFDASCHIVFVEVSNPPMAKIQSLRTGGVLTVGQGDAFADQGAISIVQVGRQMRFAINNTAARASGIRLSSRLLRLAVAVK